MNLTIQIKRKAIELGFDIAGVTDASPIEAVHIDFMTEWLKAGCAGQMSYLCRNFEKRVDPSRLLDGAKSVISVGLNYAQPASTAGGEDSGRVVSYARYEDYHPFIRKQLYEIG